MPLGSSLRARPGGVAALAGEEFHGNGRHERRHLCVLSRASAFERGPRAERVHGILQQFADKNGR